jgi:hypothetical protein
MVSPWPMRLWRLHARNDTLCKMFFFEKGTKNFYKPGFATSGKADAKAIKSF